jgi:SH3-like domain-containing protein
MPRFAIFPCTLRKGAACLSPGALIRALIRAMPLAALALAFFPMMAAPTLRPGIARASNDGGDASPGAGPPRSTGLPLPRFASLRSNEVYMRAGPGTRYPIEWIYRRKGLPVEIVAEFDTWRKVRDWNGTVGWMHRAMLSGRRMAITTATDTVIRRSPETSAPVIARIEANVVARLLACQTGWCRIEARGIRGWLPRGALWGVLPAEKFD